jgi:hypothetical protein
MAVPVAYGAACLTRGISENYFTGVLVVSNGEPARIVLGEADVDSVAGVLFQVADLQADDLGHVVLREWRCPDGERCINREGGTGLVQVDLETGDVAVIARYGGIFTTGLIVRGFNDFDVATTGEVALHVTTEDGACRRGGCDIVERVAWWDGELQTGVASGEQLSGYVVDQDVAQVIATDGGRLATVVGVWQGRPDMESHDALLCWDEEGGSTLALGRATNDQTDIAVNTVFRASVNGAGNFAATIAGDDDSTRLMMLGSCP